MNNNESMKEKILELLAEGIGVAPSSVSIDAKKDDFKEWDSVAQLGIATSLEDEFDIVLEPEDIMNCVSYVEIEKIVKRYLEAND